jgi:hypothetical protein
MPLSAYEQQRLDNIENNKRVLEALGLLDTKLVPESPKLKPKPRLPAEVTFPQVASRRSDRVSKTPALYAGLTDEFFRSEQSDDDSDDDDRRAHCSLRPQRNPKRVQTFADEFQYKVEKSPRGRTSRKPTLASQPYFGRLANMPAFASPPLPHHASICMPQFAQPKSLPVAGRGFGTSRTPTAMCPICKTQQLVRAPLPNGIVFLNMHGPCGKNVRIC